MDIADTLAPTSDQLDAVDLLGGPRTFTITKVSAGAEDQPVQVHLAEFPRVWRPSKGMRRVLAAAWGTDASAWTGRSVRLYCDPDVTFGKDKVGGIRISHMSHLPGGKRLSVPLLVSRGKAATFTVEPLTDTPKPAAHAPAPSREDIAACTDVDQLNEWAATYQGPRRDAALARLADLTADADPWAGEAE